MQQQIILLTLEGHKERWWAELMHNWHTGGQQSWVLGTSMCPSPTVPGQHFLWADPMGTEAQSPGAALGRD